MVTVLIAAVVCTSAYLRTQSDIAELRDLAGSSWTATEMHVWIEQANKAIDDSHKPLPQVGEIRQQVEALGARRSNPEAKMMQHASPRPHESLAAALLGSPHRSKRPRKTAGGRKNRRQQLQNRRSRRTLSARPEG